MLKNCCANLFCCRHLYNDRLLPKQAKHYTYAAQRSSSGSHRSWWKESGYCCFHVSLVFGHLDNYENLFLPSGGGEIQRFCANARQCSPDLRSQAAVEEIKKCGQPPAKCASRGCLTVSDIFVPLKWDIFPKLDRSRK